MGYISEHNVPMPLRVPPMKMRWRLGLCKCGKEPLRPGFKTGIACGKLAVEQNRKNQQKKTAKGLCMTIGCRNTYEHGHVLCFDCRERLRIYANNRRRERKSRNLCYRCGEPRFPGRVLCLFCRPTYHGKAKIPRSPLPSCVRTALHKYAVQLQKDAQAKELIPLKEEFMKRIKTEYFLSDRTRQWAVLYYIAGETLDQIGRQYGITRERVRQILQEVKPLAEELNLHRVKIINEASSLHYVFDVRPEIERFII